MRPYGIRVENPAPKSAVRNLRGHGGDIHSSRRNSGSKRNSRRLHKKIERQIAKREAAKEFERFALDTYLDQLELYESEVFDGDVYCESETDWQEYAMDDWRLDYDDRMESFEADTEHDPSPSTDIFMAVDRAVRRHGISEVRRNAQILAAALNVPGWEILQCINLTSAGYIQRYQT